MGEQRKQFKTNFNHKSEQEKLVWAKLAAAHGQTPSGMVRAACLYATRNLTNAKFLGEGINDNGQQQRDPSVENV